MTALQGVIDRLRVVEKLPFAEMARRLRPGKRDWRALAHRPPTTLKFETTNICNANCIFCGFQFDTRPRGVMSLELFERALGEYGDMGGKWVSLTPMIGEPLADPHFLERLDIIGKKAWVEDFYFHTNGILLNKFDMRQILLSGVNEIHISTAGFDEQMFRRMYRSDKYQRVLNNVHTLLELNRELGNPMSATALKSLTGRGIQATAEKLPPKRESLDVVFSINTLEHIWDVEATLLEVDRVLAPGGVVLLREAWGSGGPRQHAPTPLRQMDFLRRMVLIGISRVLDWLSFELGRRVPLRVWRLRPDYAQVQSDADAVSCLDSYNFCFWFRQMGYACLNDRVGPIYVKDPFHQGMLAMRKPSVKGER